MYLKVMMPQCFQFRMVPDFRNIFSDNNRDVHYIGGADVLPAPLEAEEEAVLNSMIAADTVIGYTGDVRYGLGELLEKYLKEKLLSMDEKPPYLLLFCFKRFY